MTYLELCNEVLQRLRENAVATVSQTSYSKLIGLYVNDAKRQVEDSWSWSALSVETPVITAPGTTTYTVVGSGVRQRDVVANIVTAGRQAQLTRVPLQWITDQQQLTTTQTGTPTYYAWNGNNGTDGKVELYPTPNLACTIMFNMTVPQVKLVADGDMMTVPDEPVIAGAYARALVERGEDAGLSSSEAYQMFKAVLSDYISIESSRDPDATQWVPT